MKVKWSPQAADAVISDRKVPVITRLPGRAPLVTFRDLTKQEVLALWDLLTGGYEL